MSIFKAYDIRGVYPKEINPKLAYRIGLAFSEFMKKHKLGNKIVLGRDFRHGSGDLRDAFAQALVDSGMYVSLLGICSTPCLFYHTKFFDAGVMVTASHNPKEFNGFKFNLRNAKTLGYENGLYEIEELIQSKKNL